MKETPKGSDQWKWTSREGVQAQGFCMRCTGLSELEIKLPGGNFLLIKQFLDNINTKHFI